ncbi:MAG: two-component system response regulator [Deltaproteobacteria bacterium]|nr:MAG: two-component system response regulator [Deltaproteobacteria bacterium]
MTTRHSVLIVDDDPAVGASLFRLLKQAGYDVRHEASGAAGLKAVADANFDVVISDIRMPGMDGMELLEALRDHDRSLPVVMLTAHGTIKLAVEAMRLGAKDFLTKPFEREAVLSVIDTALRATEVAQNAPPELARGSGGLVGSSKVMAECLSLVDRAAKGPAMVLVTGESGTGKELVARAIHDRSGRSDGPFIPVHCAAVPANLIESELFGHMKGIFTDATADRPGRVELAEGGTLFLDEVGDIPLSTQVKLLRLLANREYTPLGATSERKADVRFVAATHRDLNAMVAEGTFREDLLFRINVIPVHLPPLRDRDGDIAELAQHFLREIAETNGRSGMSFSEGALAVLGAHSFPGNVRELANLVERLVIFTDADTIEAADVEGHLGESRPSSPPAAPDDGGTLAEQAKATRFRAVTNALARTKNNKTQAARLIEVSRRTLHNIIDEMKAE